MNEKNNGKMDDRMVNVNQSQSFNLSKKKYVL